MRQLAAIGLVAILVSGCKKEQLSSQDCEKFQAALVALEVEDVKQYISKQIGRLDSDENTAENLNRLAQAVSRCDLSATVLCFNCIQTLPAQSEIRLAFLQNGDSTFRTLDMSSTPKNKMQCISVHE